MACRFEGFFLSVAKTTGDESDDGFVVDCANCAAAYRAESPAGIGGGAKCSWSAAIACPFDGPQQDIPPNLRWARRNGFDRLSRSMCEDLRVLRSLRIRYGRTSNCPCKFYPYLSILVRRKICAERNEGSFFGQSTFTEADKRRALKLRRCRCQALQVTYLAPPLFQCRIARH